MDVPTLESFQVMYYLLPGFLAATVFHNLTAHLTSTSTFERIVEALSFTVLVLFGTICAKSVLQFFGQYWSIGDWSDRVALGWSVIVALALGVVTAAASNNDWPHTWLRSLKITSKTWHPSEAFTAFTRDQRWITLHLKGERRLHGWPFMWPDHLDKGHFIIMQPQWHLADGSVAPLHTVDYMLLSVDDVEMIEFMKREDEVAVDEAELERVRKKLVDLQEKDVSPKCEPDTPPRKPPPEPDDDWKGSQEWGDQPT